MKKHHVMKKYTDIIYKYIFKQKSRSLAIFISIVLGVSLITCISILSKSAKQEAVNLIKLQDGNYHAIVRYATPKQFSIIKNNKNVECASLTYMLGVWTYKQRISVMMTATDKNYYRINNIKLLSGTIPSHENDIALEDWVLDNLDVPHRVGAKIKINIEGSYVKNNQSIFFAKTKVFRLSAILKNRPDKESSGIAEGITSNKALDMLNLSDKLNNNIYIKIKDYLPLESAINKVAKEAKIDNVNLNPNTMLLDALKDNSKTDDNVVLFSIIIVVVSFITIFNIVNISTSQRIREFGLMKSLGMTKKQIRSLIIKETSIISVFGVLAGLIIGLSASCILGKFAGGLFTETEDAVTSILIDPYAICEAILIGLVPSFLASLLPATKVSKISSLEAINWNQTNTLKPSTKAIKSSNMGLSFKLSFRNLSHNKNSFIFTIVAMCVAGVLFIVSSHDFYNDDKKGTVIAGSIVNGDYSIYENPIQLPYDIGYSEKDINYIKKIPGVKNVLAYNVGNILLDVNKKDIDKEQTSYIDNRPYIKVVLNGFISNSTTPGNVTLKGYMLGLTPEGLKEAKKILSKGKINLKALEKGDEAIAYIPSELDENNKLIQMFKLKVGDVLSISFKVKTKDSFKYIKKKIKIAGLLSKSPVVSGYESTTVFPDILFPSSVFKKIANYSDYRIISINEKPFANHKSVKNKITKIVKKVPTASLYDFQSEKNDVNAAENKIRFLSYSIVAVIFLISLFNIINTIYQNLIRRTSEIGMMRSIGMTRPQLRNMILSEGIVYGIVSSIFTFIAGIAAICILSKYDGVKIFFDWGKIIFMCAVNLFIGIAASLLPCRKISQIKILDSQKPF